MIITGEPDAAGVVMYSFSDCQVLEIWVFFSEFHHDWAISRRAWGRPACPLMQFDEKRVKRKKKNGKEREKVLSNCRLVPADIRERLSRSLSTRALLLPVQSCMRGRRKRKKKETLTSPFPFPLSPKSTSWKKNPK